MVGLTDKIVEARLESLYKQYGVLSCKDGLMSRFLRWYILREIKRLEKFKGVDNEC